MRKFLFIVFLFTYSFCDIRDSLVKSGIKFLDQEKTPISEVTQTKLQIDLKNPTFLNGILLTHEGGVIQNKDIRIQAKTIQYIKKIQNGKLIHRIEADTDLMIIYKNKVFIGEELEYDFVEKKGVIYSGKTYVKPWYLGGDSIILKENGSFEVKNAYITTCANAVTSWDIYAKRAKVTQKDLLHAKKVRFRFFKFPSLWLPSFKINLKKFLKKPIIKYQLNWDKSSGPRPSIRYQAYSWKDFFLFLRLDYRFQTGLGGAIETEYLPSNSLTSFVTKSYLAEDTIPKDTKKKKRYRLQGSFNKKTLDNRSFIKITWDKYSDIKMPGDFKTPDFEIDTAKKTEFILHHQMKQAITNIHARPRVNSFETIKQDIPNIYINFRPVNYKNLIFSNWLNLSYLDIAYSKDIHEFFPKTSCLRSEIYSEVFFPVNINIFTITPKAGFIGIFYSDSQNSHPKALKIFSYDISCNTILSKEYEKHKHAIIPYINFKNLTKPDTSHYIFSIKDGYNKIHLMKIGIDNQLYSLKNGKKRFSLDLYSNGFFNVTKNSTVFPKAYCDINFYFPSISLSLENSFNLDKKVWHYANQRIGWTLSENLAIALEHRYRSKYDWRKADHNNFILDVSKTSSLLLLSPLSDKRQTFLTHLFIRLNPFVTFHFASHHGYGRSQEPSYNEFNVDLFTTLGSSWKFKISYQQTETDKRFSFDYFLLKI